METIQEKTFTFSNEFDFNSNAKCETNITIEDKISNNSPVYSISYQHNIITPGENYIVENATQVKKPCPFGFYPEHIQESFDGVIVIKNEMTTSMVKFLMMEDDELGRHIGSVSPEYYRRNIMANITQFWD